MHIYKITNLIDNKMYVGQTVSKNVNDRWCRHRYNAKQKTNHPLYNSINKYGLANFKFESICSAFSLDNLNFLEKYFIEYYKTMDEYFGYNLTSGGDNKRYSEASKLKISISQKIRLAKIPKKVKVYKGHKKSEETKRKMSIARKLYQQNNLSCLAKKVLCLNNNTTFISVQETANFYKCKNAHIARVCRQERKHFKGLIFRYI